MDSLAFNLTLLDWGIFYAFWIVAAFRTKQTQKREGLAGSSTYRILALVAVWLLVGSRRFGEPFATRVTTGGDAIAWLAAASSVVGLGICLWARITLGRNWSSNVVLKRDHELVQGGPYRYVRHPIYSGIFLMFIANVLLSGRLGAWLGLLCLVVSCYVKLLREEKIMREQFPAQYPEYCQRVKRLIPFVH